MKIALPIFALPFPPKLALQDAEGFSFEVIT